MLLWACIHIPQLPLLVAEQGLCQRLPLVIETVQRQRRLVAFANDMARAAGIQVGMGVTTALTLVDALTVRAADAQREEQALQQLAVALYQFSPYIHPQRCDSLVIELSGSLRLFQGAEALAARIQQCVGGQFRQFKLSFCSNPSAALLLARSAFVPFNEPVFHPLERVGQCSVHELELAAAQQERLVSMGIERVGDLLALPRDALGRRFGAGAILYLNRLQQLEPSPRQCFQLPETFAQSVEFVPEVERAGQLVFPLQRLVSYLEQFLRVRQLAVGELAVCLRLRDQPGKPSPLRQRLSLQFAGADYRASRIMPLLQLKLERLQLDAPVVSVAVSAQHFVALSAQQQDLLCGDQVTPEERFHLLDRLKARLGERQVIGLTAVDDYRPECSWRATQAGAPQHAVAGGTGKRRESSRSRSKASASGRADSKAQRGQDIAEPAPVYAARPRPCWLLSRPYPLDDKGGAPVYGAPLQLLNGPERIETGWWDDRPVSRDYYLARHDNGKRYWVFYDQRRCRWFLHGIYG